MTVMSARIAQQRVCTTHTVEPGKASLRKQRLGECVWGEGGNLQQGERPDSDVGERSGTGGISSKGCSSQKGQPNAQTHQTGKSLQTKPPLAQQFVNLQK